MAGKKEREVDVDYTQGSMENNLLIPIRKKGDRNQYENYTSICLGQTKIFIMFILYGVTIRVRLHNSFDSRQNPSNSGYRD